LGISIRHIVTPGSSIFNFVEKNAVCIAVIADAAAASEGQREIRSSISDRAARGEKEDDSP